MGILPHDLFIWRVLWRVLLPLILCGFQLINLLGVFKGIFSTNYLFRHMFIFLDVKRAKISPVAPNKTEIKAFQRQTLQIDFVYGFLLWVFCRH